MIRLDFLTSWLGTATLYHYISAYVQSTESQNLHHACTVGCYSFLIFLFVDVLCTSKCKEQCKNELRMYLVVTIDKKKGFLILSCRHVYKGVCFIDCLCMKEDNLLTVVYMAHKI